MVKGVGEVKFPDTMSEDDVRNILRQKFSQGMSVSDRLNVPAVASPYEPTLLERTGTGIGNALYNSGVVSDRFRAMDTGKTFGNILGFTPMGAAAIAGDTFGRDLRDSDYLGATGSAIEGLLEVNPVTNAIGTGLSAALPIARKVTDKAKGLFDELGESVDQRQIDMGFDPDQEYYHGTLSDITEFDTAKASPEGHFGSGIYVTTGVDDASYNYATSSGADISNKIDRLAENIEVDDDIPYEKAREIAEQRLSQNMGNVMPLKIKEGKQFDITEDSDVTLSYERETPDWEDFLDDADGDEDYARELAYEASFDNEPTGELADFIESFSSNASEYSNDNVDSFIDEVMSYAMDEDGISARDLDSAFRDSNVYVEGDDGAMIGNEIYRKAIEDAGFDSVRHPADIFNMGDTAGQDHIILFRSDQVRSKNAKFDKTKAKSGNILAGFGGLGLLGLMGNQEDDQVN